MMNLFSYIIFFSILKKKIYKIDRSISAVVLLKRTILLDEFAFEGEPGEIFQTGSVGFGMAADNVVLFLLLLKYSVLVEKLRLHQVVAILRHTRVHSVTNLCTFFVFGLGVCFPVIARVENGLLHSVADVG